MFQKVLSKTLVAVHRIKDVITLNNPSYVGLCMSDLNKNLIYGFYYNHINQNYGQKANPLFTDTGSVTNEIKKYYVYEDVQKEKYKFDFW